MEAHDVVVVGLGAMGSAALRELSRRHVDVLGIDEHSPPHPFGSTHGESRITRLATGEGQAYVPLAMRSQQLWRELEVETGRTLLTCNGCLVLGREGAGFGIHGRHFLEDTITAARTFAIEHELLDAAQLTERFPQLALVGDERGYLEPSGGFARPEACVDAMLTVAVRDGAEVRRNERVEQVTLGGGGAVVRTAHGDIAANQVVVSAGAAVADLVGPEIGNHVSVHRQTMHWFATSPPHDMLSPERLPVFIWELSEKRFFYGFPEIDGPGSGLKVASERDDPVHNLRDVERDVGMHESMDLFDDLVGPRIPQLERRRLRAVTCLYTAASDFDFIIDRHPRGESVWLVSPCSGHGFKHSAAIGEAVAQLVTTGSSDVDLAPFALSRFGR